MISRAAWTTVSLMALTCVTAPLRAEGDAVQKSAAPAWAVSSELLDVPTDASGLLFVRRNDVTVRLDDQSQQHVHYRMKVLHPQALELGNISIVWNPAAGTASINTLVVHRGKEARDVTAQASFEVLRREDQLEAAHLDGNLTAVLRVPDLRVGDELEVAFTVPTDDPTLGKDDAGVLFLAGSLPPGRYSLALSWAAGHQPRLQPTADMVPVQTRIANGTRFAIDNPPIMMPPKDAPGRYQWQRIVEYSDYADWEQVSRKFGPLYASASHLPAGSPLKAEAQRIMAHHQGPLDRARAALKLVQQEVRYIYVGLDGGNLRPATAEETWQRRYGDCKGKTALLLALLNDMGIEASVVAVNNAGGDDGFDKRLPNPGLFDHVLVRASIDGQSYWFDGTLPPQAPPALRPALPYRWVLPLTEAGETLQRVPRHVSEVPDLTSLVELDARDGFDKPARVVSTTITRGIKGLEQQAQLSALTPAQLLDAFRQHDGGQTWRSIDDVKLRYDVGAGASILTITGDWVLDWDEDDGERSLSLPGGGFRPPERRVRPSEQNQDAPFAQTSEFRCDVTTVRIPSSTNATDWFHNSAYNTRIFGRAHYRAFERRGDTLRMIRVSRVELDEIPVSLAQADNERIAAFDNSMAWIFHDPAGDRTLPKTAKPVPATFEIDWITNSSSCMPPASSE